MNLSNLQIHSFEQQIHQKEFVFAYPTEAVYGLGANPFDELAVKRILLVKQRPAHQHFILIAANWKQIIDLIDLASIEKKQYDIIASSWPGPITWVFPASPQAPLWLVSNNKTIAIRITDHPLAKTLCEIAKHPLVSTSANISGQPPCYTYEDTCKVFKDKIDLIIEGQTGQLSKPTPIRDARTGEFLRI